jgi:ribokinase
LVGRVCDDAMGAQAHLDLRDRGITDRLATDRDRPTGTCIVLVDSEGERTMIPDPGANVALVPDDLDPAAFTHDGHLHVSGYALLGAARPAALAALDRARGVGMTVSLDAASAAPLAAAGAEEFASWIGVDLLLFANRAEAEVLTGIADPAQAARLLSHRFGYAVVKAGADGAYWSDGTGALTYLPSVKLAKVVDTTGAGDAFAAMFLSAISVGSDPARALQQATAMAAVACLQAGGRPPRDAIAAARLVLVELTQP